MIALLKSANLLEIVASLLVTCVVPAEEPSIDFKSYDGYFESNDSGLKGERSTLAITTEADFKKRFGAGYAMGDSPRILPEKAFETRMVVALIKRGHEYWDYRVEKVTRRGDTLIVKYSSISHDGGSAEFASPLVISVPKGDYRSVTFIEGGKEVGSSRFDGSDREATAKP